jgi:hypothetical protein
MNGAFRAEADEVNHDRSGARYLILAERKTATASSPWLSFLRIGQHLVGHSDDCNL